MAAQNVASYGATTSAGGPAGRSQRPQHDGQPLRGEQPQPNPCVEEQLAAREQEVFSWASGLLIAATVLALYILLAGRGGNSLGSEGFAIVTYNVSYLGHDLVKYPSELAANIAYLVGQNNLDEPSYTRYLHIADWYSVHYLADCWGMWTVGHDGRLTDEKTILACANHGPSSRFSLRETLAGRLDPSVRDLINYIPVDLPEFDTTATAALHITGLSFVAVDTAVTSLVLEFGRSKRFNIYAFSIFMVVIAWTALTMSGALNAGAVQEVSSRAMGFGSQWYQQMMTLVGSLAGMGVVVQHTDKFARWLHRKEWVGRHPPPPTTEETAQTADETAPLVQEEEDADGSRRGPAAQSAPVRRLAALLAFPVTFIITFYLVGYLLSAFQLNSTSLFA